MIGLFCVLHNDARAQDFDKDEFANRRAQLFERTGDGVIIIIGATEHPYPLRFRQTPDFHYLTGIDEGSAVLVMDGATDTSTVFAKVLPAQLVTWLGGGVMNDPDSENAYGIALRPLSELTGYLEEVLSDEDKVYVTTQSPDLLQQARQERAMQEMFAARHPLVGERPTEQDVAIESIKSIQPDAEYVDISGALDTLRWTKSPYEIERMRESGRIAADGFLAAMSDSRAGMWEYEFEAKARFAIQNQGAGDAFMPIVASGPNTLTIHYVESDRQTQPGDVMLMDYGADYDYYTTDITRMWPVSGRFTERQEQMYRCILDASKAIIAAIKPGVTVEELQDVGEEVYKEHGFLEEYMAWNRYVGHAVGMSVHDPNPGAGPAPDTPFEVGTIWNVEPVITMEEEGVHMRLEDTILVTQDGAENLTAGVPVELEAIYALVNGEAEGSR